MKNRILNQPQISIIVGSYQIGYTIGQGTFGKVKIAKHLLTLENVAVKIFEKERIKKSGEIKRVMQEIKILKELSHPNIVKIYEIIQTPDKIYIVMEYVENGELFTFIKTHKKYPLIQLRIEEKLAARLYFELISVVEYLQKHNVVHRDIKPENILLNDKFSLKLADFGLSNYFEEHKKLSSSCGSPSYALPEMLIGESYDAKAADVWSSGIVLFAMVCGYLPFEDNDVILLYKKICKQPLEFLPQVSVELKDLLNNVLHKNKEKRYTLQQIKYHKWLVKFCKANYRIEQNSPHVKQELLKQLELYGVEQSYAKYCLEIRKHNFVTTIYYLLKKKSQRQPNFKFITSESTCLTIKQKLSESQFSNEEYNFSNRQQIANNLRNGQKLEKSDKKSSRKKLHHKYKKLSLYQIEQRKSPTHHVMNPEKTSKNANNQENGKKSIGELKFKVSKDLRNEYELRNKTNKFVKNKKDISLLDIVEGSKSPNVIAKVNNNNDNKQSEKIQKNNEKIDKNEKNNIKKQKSPGPKDSIN